MLINGEFNVFRPEEAKAILRKAHAALEEGGTLLLEPHTFEAVRRSGEPSWSWYSSDSSLFSDRPHVCLQERSWHADTNTATYRYYIVDAATGDVSAYAATHQAYSEDEYRSVLSECGFDDIQLFPSLTGVADESQGHYIAIVGRKRAAVG
jgi:hypothetical protein